MSCAISQPCSSLPSLATEVTPLPRELPGFRGCHAGETIVVCGCGVSLQTLVNPERFVTIGVNDVGRMFTPDYLVVVNPRNQFQGDRFRYVEESRARAIFTQLELGLKNSHVVRFSLGKRGGTDFSNANTLDYTNNSPYVAVCLAIHMGARKIGIIGVDFTNNHFFAQTGQHPLERQLLQIDREYKCLYDACLREGVEVFNLSANSRLTAVPKLSLAEFAGREETKSSLRIVSYATTPVAGVPVILSRAIAARTPHACRTVWASNSYGNGVAFDGDVEWDRASAEAEDLLRSADVVIAHNGKVDPRHRPLLADKPVITMAHNYMWNVETRFVERGFPGLVVGQYQATLPEFKDWKPVPNPVPLWEPSFQTACKPKQLTICYTPSGKHEVYPEGHRLYWHSKGYATTMRILDSLAKRFPINLEVIRGHQVTHSESLAMKRRAHIVIDECVTGSYHRNSLEGLALGCVVVNGMGRLAAVTDVFHECAGTDGIPFARAGLNDLEAVLTSLIEQGPDALAATGARNRAWMEEHWDFERQWQRFWEPAVTQALERPSRTKARVCMPREAMAGGEKSMSCETAAKEWKQGLSVVVCHGGEARLPQLSASLANLRQCQGPSEIIVVDMGPRPFAEEIARRWADKYIFVRNDDAFERARSLNIGTALAEYDLVLWLDNDMITPKDFLAKAVADMRARRLDYLIPYVSVNYLSETDSQRVKDGVVGPADCRPAKTCRALYVCGGAGIVRKSFVLTYGGLSEKFRGWGGEDGAWWHKARLLGRAEVAQQQDQQIYHLFHLNSGLNGGSQHRDSNPYYAGNVAVLEEMRCVRDRDAYLKRFPPQPLFSCAWKEKRVLLIGQAPQETDRWIPVPIGRALTELTGIQVEHRSAGSVFEREDRPHPDAVVLFGVSAATAFLSNQSLKRLWKKAVAVHDGSAMEDPAVQRLAEAGGILCEQGPGLEALQQSGLHPWPIPFLDENPDPSYPAALRILQPLSKILGMSGEVTETATGAREEADLSGSQKGQAVSSLTDVSILITSFLRPGYLKDCLAGIEKNLPECKVIVVDDSGGQPLDSGTRCSFISLPFDSGLSAKRNAGVKACTTKYLLMGSDDFDFSTREARDGIDKLVRALDDHPMVDIAGGHHNNQRYEGFLELVPGSHIKETRLFASHDHQGSPQSLSEQYEVYKVDLIVNYFLARTDSIRSFPWDERMKIGGEHGDWFLTLKQAGKTVVWVAGVNINELPRDKSKEHPDYGRYRGRAVSLGHRIFLEKRGIKHYFGFDDPVPATRKPGSKTLIAIITCKENVDRVRALQDTWIPVAMAAGYDVQIFDGERLGVPDDYYSLIQKTQAVCKWALAQGHERLLKVDDDCSIRVHQLRPNTYDYAGIVVAANDLGSMVPPSVPAKSKGTYPHNYASGGAYWLSHRAMTLVAHAHPNGDWAEDRFVGDTLARHGIFVQRVPDYTWVIAGRMPHHWTVLTQLPTPALIRKAFR